LKKIPTFLLPVLSGLLLYAAWPMSPLTFLIFVAFVPLLALERQGIRRGRFFGWVYLSMLIWNIGATCWIWNSTGPGTVAAIVANSLLMCLPWLAFHWVRRNCGNAIGYISLAVFWLSFEYIHLQNWGLSWPWLTLGNVFATHPDWVQWYEYTGTSGGGVWIMTANILIFYLWIVRRKRALRIRLALLVVALLVFPPLISVMVRPGVDDRRTDYPDVVLVQPNIDPYGKLVTGSLDAQLQLLIRLSESAIDSNTKLVVWPETAIYSDNGFIEDHLKDNFLLRPLWAFLRRHPGINLMTGIESVRLFAYKHSPTAVKIPDTDEYAETYNAAIVLDSSGLVSFHHKTKLVPGVETLPPFLHFLDPLFEKFGGATGSYTGESERTPLTTSNKSYTITPAVCFESIYGEFLAQFVHNGAGLIAVITNDGWWGNTPGHLQHVNYARLRAIETRRWVVQSGNTGISCFIDPAGVIVESGPWEEPAVIRRPVPSEAELTFYVRYGDCVSKIALGLAALILVWNIITIIKSKTRHGKIDH
jgi:apolipoprotein N-acyltransferase